MASESRASVWVDATDFVEFATRGESPSGVQRVVAALLPRLLDRGARAIALDRHRGLFVEIDAQGLQAMLSLRAPRQDVVEAASHLLTQAASEAPVELDSSAVVVFPGAVWINDSLMLAARSLHSQGAQFVFLLYDMTPVLETGHTAAVNRLYERYLSLVCDTGARTPAISESSRRDFASWAAEHGKRIPDGVATGLPNALVPHAYATDPSPWPRPYALFVGTIESRKNHLVALQAWRTLVERHGRDAVPDLVCIGRLGWHADEFLREMTTSDGLNGKVTMLTSSVPDEELARFYAHAEFSVYPSRYEGWGLPISESLAFGVPVIAADNSSLREAGGQAATYVPTGDVGALARAVEERFITGTVESLRGDGLRQSAPEPPTWDDVVSTLWSEVVEAASHRVETMVPVVDVGREYYLGVSQPAPDGAHADKFLAHLTTESRTPLLRQERRETDFETTDAVMLGAFGPPQVWGLQLAPNTPCTVRFTRAASGPLTLLVSTRSMPGQALVETVSPAGFQRHDLYLGSVLSVELGDGVSGDVAQVRITVVDASDSIEGFVGIRSFVVLASDDLAGQLAVERAAAQALRQELDFITGTRSWKVTAPLRRWKGRGAS